MCDLSGSWVTGPPKSQKSKTAENSGAMEAPKHQTQRYRICTFPWRVSGLLGFSMSKLCCDFSIPDGNVYSVSGGSVTREVVTQICEIWNSTRSSSVGQYPGFQSLLSIQSAILPRQNQTDKETGIFSELCIPPCICWKRESHLWDNEFMSFHEAQAGKNQMASLYTWPDCPKTSSSWTCTPSSRNMPLPFCLPHSIHLHDSSRKFTATAYIGQLWLSGPP